MILFHALYSSTSTTSCFVATFTWSPIPERAYVNVGPCLSLLLVLDDDDDDDDQMDFQIGEGVSITMIRGKQLEIDDKEEEGEQGQDEGGRYLRKERVAFGRGT